MRFVLTTDEGQFISLPLQEVNRNNSLLLNSYNFLLMLHHNVELPENYKQYAEELIGLYEEAIKSNVKKEPITEDKVEIKEEVKEVAKANNVFVFPPIK